jgi:hypothetical protein
MRHALAEEEASSKKAEDEEANSETLLLHLRKTVEKGMKIEITVPFARLKNSSEERLPSRSNC